MSTYHYYIAFVEAPPRDKYSEPSGRRGGSQIRLWAPSGDSYEGSVVTITTPEGNPFGSYFMHIQVQVDGQMPPRRLNHNWSIQVHEAATPYHDVIEVGRRMGA